MGILRDIGKGIKHAIEDALEENKTAFKCKICHQWKTQMSPHSKNICKQCYKKIRNKEKGRT